MTTRGQIKLRKHLTDKRLRQKQFALAMQTTEATVSRWLSGTSTPSDEMKRQIEVQTKRAVRAADWLVEAEIVRPESAA